MALAWHCCIIVRTNRCLVHEEERKPSLCSSPGDRAGLGSGPASTGFRDSTTAVVYGKRRDWLVCRTVQGRSFSSTDREERAREEGPGIVSGGSSLGGSPSQLHARKRVECGRCGKITAAAVLLEGFPELTARFEEACIFRDRGCACNNVDEEKLAWDGMSRHSWLAACYLRGLCSLSPC